MGNRAKATNNKEHESKCMKEPQNAAHSERSSKIAKREA